MPGPEGVDKAMITLVPVVVATSDGIRLCEVLDGTILHAERASSS